MIESKLKQIASELNGEYTIEDYKMIFTDGSRSPETYHIVKYEYAESEILILIQTGFTETARVITTLSTYTRPIEFEIDCVSPFENLFLRRKTRFKVKCKNQNFKFFLENEALMTFDNIMETENFNPRIFMQNNESNDQIVMEFHLGFPKWTEIFDEINLFLKSIIDELNSDNRFISHKVYKEKN
ncbi:hypothetical protein Q4Q35_16330 [Flavivirga aquimarina]|uniref:DUF3137 domain-containing protein n=1 Tax=Flavivirga aquimarina TaxID=2027862 RepID=A0ABT8WE20_9FLAO|nr:hypothetical protein [Flavivirga aquimarina]MDO5971375.1 hypothetical protein [Flavivirga aquimarina]